MRVLGRQTWRADVQHLQGEAGALEAAAKACGQAEELSQMAGKLKLCLPQMTRLSVLARFILLQLTDPEADPEREQIKDLRLLVKKSLYKEHMCLAKGRIQFDVCVVLCMCFVYLEQLVRLLPPPRAERKRTLPKARCQKHVVKSTLANARVRRTCGVDALPTVAVGVRRR